jgi:hypothetical protein
MSTMWREFRMDRAARQTQTTVSAILEYLEKML